MTGQTVHEAWLSWLEHERRSSPRTQESYNRDVKQWLTFLEEQHCSADQFGRQETRLFLSR